MSAIAYHIRFRLVDDRVIAQSPCHRRIVSRVILDQGQKYKLLSFGLADNHFHVLAGCSFVEAGQLARRIEISLAKTLSLPASFQPAHREPVMTQKHLRNALGYDLRQDNRHALDLDPFYETTNLPDLLKMRLIGNYTRINVKRMLPRVSRADLLRLLRVPYLELQDGPLEMVRLAAILASGLPNLSSSSLETLEVKYAVIHVVGKRLSAQELSGQLGLGIRTVYRQRAVSPNQHLVEAIRLQLCLIQIRMHNGMKLPDFDEMTT